MSNLIATLIFINLLQIVLTEPPIEIQNSLVQTEEHAAQLLVEILPKQVLPLVFFNVPTKEHTSKSSKNELRLPQDLKLAVISDRRMVRGTEFSINVSGDQMFFCPKQNSEENCLVPQTFGETEPLQCAKEPELVSQKDTEDTCGPGKAGTLYYTAYEICPNDDNYATENTPIIYELCYKTTKRRTLHTIHTIISPPLLKSNLLFRERSVPYQFIEDQTLKPLHFDGMSFPSNADLNSLTHPHKPDYRIQMLVPHTDMAFALWRKSTYQSFNLNWQHAELIPLWNKINNYVKSKAIQMINENTTLRIRTAVFDIIPPSKDNAIISNIWGKMVFTVPSKALTRIRGIAILMNNFTTNTIRRDQTELESTKEAIEAFCEDDLCVKSLHDDFEAVQGTVRCCSITTEISEIFGTENTDPYMPIFHIPGITSELNPVEGGKKDTQKGKQTLSYFT